MGESRQRYNVELKKETVKYIQERSKSLPQIAEELNIPTGTLKQWLAKYREFPNEPLIGSGDLREEARNAKKLEERIRDLEKKSDALLQQRPEARFLFIEDHRSKFRVEKMCKVTGRVPERILQVAQVTPKLTREAAGRLAKRIQYHYEGSDGLYGSPKITHSLRREGRRVSEEDNRPHEGTRAAPPAPCANSKFRRPTLTITSLYVLSLSHSMRKRKNASPRS